MSKDIEKYLKQIVELLEKQQATLDRLVRIQTTNNSSVGHTFASTPTVANTRFSDSEKMIKDAKEKVRRRLLESGITPPNDM